MTNEQDAFILENLLLGVGSSSYQVEGGATADGKGINVMDFYSKIKPDWTADGSNGEVACDSYHKYKIDVDLLKELGVNCYRFSISWPRILPTGDPTKINQAGLNYYNNLIDELLKHDIEPVVTIYHWDLPQTLQELGGWTNPIIIDFFVDYSRILFLNFSKKVKFWVTLNEPSIISLFGYGDSFEKYPPGLEKWNGIAEYLSVHSMLLAHAKVYRLYKAEFNKIGGQIGIVANLFNYIPNDTSEESLEAAERATIFEGGWILDPLIFGDYPDLMKSMIDRNSANEGRSRSRLPIFTVEEKQLIIGTLDFIGINHYSTFCVKNGESGRNPSHTRDTQTISCPNKNLFKIPGASWLTHDEKGLRQILNWLKVRYNNLPVFITENGCDDPKGIEDMDRVLYHKGHILGILNAIREDKCNVIGYIVWSLMDSFEWVSGYKFKFGIYHVDFKHPDLIRSKKKSFEFFNTFFKLKKLL